MHALEEANIKKGTRCWHMPMPNGPYLFQYPLWTLWLNTALSHLRDISCVVAAAARTTSGPGSVGPSSHRATVSAADVVASSSREMHSLHASNLASAVSFRQ